MRISLSEHFSYKKLLRFTLPSIVMMIFTSVYGVIDGLFVSNFVGKTPFTAVNLIMPFLMALGAIGFMFGTGGSAVVAKTMGEGEPEKANRLFSMFVYIPLILAVVIAAVGIIFLRPISILLGAEGEILDCCISYGRIILCALPFYVLQYEFQSFFVTAEKPQLGLIVTVAAGLSNIVLDALLVAVFKLGLNGAAFATAFSQFVGGAIPVIYFSKKNKSILRLTKMSHDIKAFFKGCANGLSELLSNISMSVVSMLYNFQLIKYAGNDGVAAYGVLMYVNFIFAAVFIGYSVGSAPIVSYHFGAQHKDEVKNVLRKSIVITGLFSVAMLVLSQALASPLSKVFVGYDAELYSMTVNGFKIFSFSFLFSGIAIFGSSFFTALNNGIVSALISFSRTALFQVAAVLILPIFFELNGIWLSIVVAEIMSAAISAMMIVGLRKKYGY